ncbi:hypothetical protein DAEQUDRAFT_764257 [Daedalea quercina L-15889]|uniref:Uncharacterized protein n=1 Tax=Daedalea quercina L-15889 TaxID=1314783 RepID=A0A165RQC3_9APHY|nr:hypothetical protein DAEQUDRAFT_764257 [Daedalea quercina L-15889]
MCNLHTEGYKYACGHYIIENKKAKVDCGSPWCVHSRKHRTPCPNCACEKYYGPDASETVLGLRPGFCPECRPWYKNQNGGR